MGNLDIDLPDNADKLLFAEDLVSFIMTELYFNPYEGTVATPYRDFIHNAFNDVVKVTVNEIGIHLISQNYYLYEAIEKLDPVEDLYEEIIDHFKDYYKTDGFNPKFFIMFCINVTNVGAIMRNNDFGEAAEMAISAIYEFIKDVDMLNTGWDTLTMSCLPLFNDWQARNSLLTPEPSSPESSSPDIDRQFSDGILSEEDTQMSSSSDKSDSSEHSVNKIEFPMEQNEIQVNMADAIAAAINSSSLNVGNFSLSTRKEHLQPNVTVEMETESKTESTVNETTLPYSISDVFQIKEAENCLKSCLAILEGFFKTVDSLQEDKTSTHTINANSETEKHLTDTEVLTLKADSATLQNTLQLPENTAHLPPLGECNVLPDDDCTMTKQEDNEE